MRSLLVKAAAWAKSDDVTDRIVRGNGLLRARAQQAVDAMRTGSPEENEAQMQALTLQALQTARKTRYGSRYPLRLEGWPLLSKASLRERPGHFVNPFVWPRIPAGTGGTTGMPVALWRSLESIAAEQAFLDELLKPHGCTMQNSRVAILRAETVKPPTQTDPPYGRISHKGLRLTLSLPHLSAATLPWYHDALLRFAPSVLWVYPSAAANLMTLLARAGLRLPIPVILASSEELSTDAHTALAEYFSAQVINYYGQAERVCLAVSTQPGIFYFHPAYGHVELLTPEALPGGECRARILATGFWNRAMPLVRYDTGDYIYLSSEFGEKDLLDIARGIRPFSGMAGRDNEYVVTREGLHIIGLNQIPREIDTIYRMQILQTDCETVHIHVLAKPGFTRKDAARIEAQAKAKLPASMAVSVAPVEKLEVTERGKTPFVIRRF